MTEDLFELTLRDVSAAIREGRLDREAYSAHFAARRQELNPVLNAFITTEERPASHDKGGVLAGIPVAIKDNIETIGMKTTCGSKLLENYVSPRDATVVERLVSSGAGISGKTNLDEFAMGSSNEHSSFGVCRNPWDTDRVPGGSSGGSAAAVAAGMIPVALGSDTGGSVRQPAAFCGVVGIKPTWGRVSRSGLVAFASSLDQIGVIARRVDDAALLLESIAGHDPRDATSAHVEVPDWSPAENESLDGLRIGVVREAKDGVSDELRANLEAAVDVMANSGATIEEASLPALEYSVATYYLIANAEASANLARYDGVRYGRRAKGVSDLAELYLRSRSEGFGPEVKRRIMLGTFALSSGYHEAYYGRAQSVRNVIRRNLEEVLSQYDILVTPTTPEPAFTIGDKSEDLLSMYLSDIMTAPASLSGHPAIAIPSGFTDEGLPLSIQLIGRRFDEGTLFRAGRVFEEVTRFYEKRPSVSA